MLANTITYSDNDVIHLDNTLNNTGVTNLDNMLANGLSNNDRANVINLDNTSAHIVLQI